MKREDKSTSFHQKSPIEFNGKKLTFERCRIMGILNLTANSFYDGGRYNSIGSALKQADKMIEAGADIIDLGATSTRPGAPATGPQEELEKMIPVLEQLRKSFPASIISIDTYFEAVARRAIDMGADMINDISGGTFDPEMMLFIASNSIPYVIMHIQGRPDNMQEDPQYDDVVTEVREFLFDRARLIARSGNNQLIIDPGFGFGKTVDHNYELLKNLDTFHEVGYPVLVGISRKSMINRILKTKPESALNGTTVLHTLSILKGADILRVHDVKEAVETVKLVGYFSSM